MLDRGRCVEMISKVKCSLRRRHIVAVGEYQFPHHAGRGVENRAFASSLTPIEYKLTLNAETRPLTQR